MFGAAEWFQLQTILDLLGCFHQTCVWRHASFRLHEDCSICIPSSHCMLCEQDVKAGLSGVTVVSGQLDMTACTIHDCSYGIEVGVDAHACISDSSICFTECALMCEGHMALTGCKIWGNVATWHGCATLAPAALPQQLDLSACKSRHGSRPRGPVFWYRQAWETSRLSGVQAWLSIQGHL